jgi:pantoate--beta-alanine ligase
MKIIRSIKQMQEASKSIKQKGKTIGFVPTMGALHEGHLSLIRRARKDNDKVVVSIFVNPAQFGPKEDFKKYPRQLKIDAAFCKEEGADIIFYPDAEQMYPAGYKTYVDVGHLSRVLCGKFRPGHFRGVATVVAKLFNIVRADIAYFGQKDAQQAAIIRKMSQDLNMPLKIKALPTVREESGLAMSSRNSYLTAKQRKDAAILYLALNLARRLIKQGNRKYLDIIKKMRWLIAKKKNISVQYISIVNLENLLPVKRAKGKVLVALAAQVGKTRLIDNIVIDLSKKLKLKRQNHKEKLKSF